MSHFDDNAYLSLADLIHVTGGQAINFDQVPADAVAQVNNRMATCRALGAQERRLNPSGSRLNSTGESEIFKAQAEKCWKSLRE